MFSTRTSIILTIVFISITLLAIPTAREKTLQAVFFVAEPLLLYGAETGDAIHSFSQYGASVKRLLEEREELRKENLRLKFQLVDYEILRQELEDIKKIVSVKGSYDAIGMKVVGGFSDASGISLIVSAGKDDGIAVFDPVITDNRILVGKIARVYSGLSTVSLLRNSGTTLGVFIIPQHNDSLQAASTSSRRETPIEGLLIGKGDDLVIDLVPNDADVEVGDLVVTDGFEGVRVKNLIIGEVVSAKRRETTVFQDIHVRELISAKRIQNVFVLTSRIP